MRYFGSARVALGGLLLLALTVGACGDDDDPGNETATASTTSTAAASATPGASTTPTTPAGETPAATNTPGGGDSDVPASFDDGTDAVRALMSYYNAINRGEYDRAYGYWRTPTQSEDEFAKGFADTASSVATLRPASGIDAAAGNRRMLVGAVIAAEQTDGSVQRFSGCYAMWRAAEGVSDNPEDNSWRIDEALIAPLGDDAPLATVLADACAPWADRVSMYDAPYDNRTGSVNVAYSLYDAVNREQFERGYGYWESPEPSYDEFVNGYANTASTVVTLGAPAHTEGAAGSVYEEVPVVVRSTLTDGTEQVFSGCYVMRRSNMPGSGGEDPSVNPWSIYSATMAAAANDVGLAALLRNGCA